MPLQIDAQKQYRYARLIEKVRQAQSQMRSLRFVLQQVLIFIANNQTFLQEVAALPEGDYVLSSVDSPKREEILNVLKAMLSYAHYAGYVTLEQYQALTGDQDPVPPNQINALIDSWVTD